MVKKYKDTSQAGKTEGVKYSTDQSMDLTGKMLEVYIPSELI